MDNVKLVCDRKDYRTAVVLDDVQGQLSGICR
jgi:hypothetical protein